MTFDSVRIAARTLGKQPVFASVVILSLALAIALNTTMYSVLDALIHPRMDVRSPGQLYTITYYGDFKYRVDDIQRDRMLRSGMRTYDAITHESRMFGQPPTVQAGSHLAEAMPVGVGVNYFDVLGVHAMRGRTFLAGDELAGVAPVVVSERLADELFPGGVSPLGKRISVNLTTYQVIGVVSRYASIPGEHTDIWVPTPVPTQGGFVRMIRVRDGFTRVDVERELQAISDQITIAAGTGPGTGAFRLHSVVDVDFQFRGFHLAMVLAVVAVLLVACSNLANIQLARGIGRSRELALRAALGASRGRLIAHLILESALLAAAGLALGLVLTVWSAHLLVGAIPAQVSQYVVQPQWSWRVLVFALAATACCVVLVGLLPAIRVSRADPNELLKSGAGTGATRKSRRQYGILVAAEIALALVLSSGAAVLMHSALDADDNTLAYNPHPLATGWITMRETPGSSVQISALLANTASRLRAISGVDAAATSLSIRPEHVTVSYSDEGGVHEYPSFESIDAVSPAFLRTVGLPVVRGRDFLDGQPDEGAVIVDQQTARILWPNSNPVGQQIKFGDHRSTRPFLHVVGVATDNMDARTARLIRRYNVNIRNLGSIYYVPGIRDTVVVGKFHGVFLRFVSRSVEHPERMPLVLRNAVRGWNDALFSNVQTMEQSLGLADLRATRNFVSRLFAMFAALGLGLAAFGVYGVVAHSVAERRRELGVRIALGASANDILHAVLRESVAVGLAGVAVGLLMTKYGIKLLAVFAIEDDFFNAPLFACVALVLFAVAAASALGPALKATRIDPTESMRCE